MLEALKFQARVQGAEIEDDDTEEKEKAKSDMTFKDPKEYEHLSKKEKVELTEKMKGYHRQTIKIG